MYEPELGQMVFGNKWEEYGVPKTAGDMLYELSKKLCDPRNDPCYGVEFVNDIFEMHKYYWGDECTCGFEELEDEWYNTHTHKENCLYFKYLSLKNKLIEQGHSVIDEEYKRQMAQLCEANGVSHIRELCCNCGYDEEYAKWRETHDHKPDCPIVRPNFWYKPTDLKIYWYKYIGRSMSANQKIKVSKFREIIDHCIQSAQQEIKEVKEAKKKYKQEYKQWYQRKEKEEYLCHKCWYFLGETKDGKVICMDNQNEETEEVDGMEVIGITPIPIDYKKQCDMFYPSRRSNNAT